MNNSETRFKMLCEVYDINLDKIYKDGFNFEQAKVIAQAMRSGSVPSLYNPKYNADQMFQMYLAVREDDYMTHLVNETFTAEQMAEIRMGYIYFACRKQYLNPNYTAEQLKQIRIGLANRIDVSKYADVNNSAGEMERIRRELMKTISISWSDFIDCTQDIAIEIHKLFMKGVNIGVFYDEYDLSVEYIRELGELLDSNPDLDYYINLYDTVAQLREIDIWLKHRLDPDEYLHGQFDCEQMRQIRLGLEDCIDVTKYNGVKNGISPIYTAEEMKNIRLKLLNESISKVSKMTIK